MRAFPIAMTLAGLQLVACHEAPTTAQAADSALLIAPAIVVERPPEPGRPVPILNTERKAAKAGGRIG
jgi:hypothetical protein